VRALDIPVGGSWYGNPLLSGASRRGTFEPQQTIYRAGATGDTVYLVRRGFIKMVSWSASGTERIVRVARRNDAVGLRALLRCPHRRSAIAMSEVEVICVPTNLVAAAGRANPEFGEQILAHYHASIEMADLLLTEFNTGRAHARVARLLMYLMEADGDDTCFLPRREDMAALLGTTAETNSRVVATFRRTGLIELLRPDRCRCNLGGLGRIASQ
jgi:CRP/FNR family transcriptional regulator